MVKRTDPELDKLKLQLKVEKSLDRVRNLAMRMKKSDDLKKVVSVLFEEMGKLGFDLFDSNIAILDKETRDLTYYGSGLGGIDMPPGFVIPYQPGQSSYMDAVYNDQKKGKKFNAFEFSGKALDELKEFYMTKTEFGKAPEEYIKGMLSPEHVVLSYATMKYGLLEVAGPEVLDTDKKEILKRFAGVLELTYTRFYDLQKAEAQAREAEIQLVLERVRAASMSMQKSIELHDVIKVISEQIIVLGIKFDHTTFIQFNDDNSIEVWVTTPEQPYPAQIHVPFIDHAFFRIQSEMTKIKSDFLAEVYNREEKNRFFRHFFKNTSARNIPKDRQNYVLQAPGMARYTFRVSTIYFSTANYDCIPYTDEETSILSRFAKVFEQTYTRFLDLQKAEAQAREAQIEAALERVRAAGMAMHSSEDLAEASTILFEQLVDLGIEARRVGFALPDDEKQEFTVWSTIRGDDGKASLLSAFFYYDQHPIYPKMIENWHAGNKLYSCELHGKDVQGYYKAWNKTMETPKTLLDSVKKNKSEYYQFAFFKQGIIYAFTAQPLSEEQNQLLLRFAKAFELTYTRFLDLQKAETQAREAEIQLALERVRARTMAMHKSEELAEVSAVLFQQLNVLGNSPERINIGIIKEEKRIIEYWATDQNGHQIGHRFNATIEEPTTIAKVYAGWKENKKSMIVDLRGDELKRWMHYLIKELKMPFREELIHDRRVHTVAFFSHGMLLISTPEPLPGEALNLLERFAEVFNLTYRRFLDLQKAEAQTREARIEAALERVRARSMAMHKSEELADVALELFEQVKLLGIETWATGFNVWLEGNTSYIDWVVNGSTGQFLEPYRVDLTAHPYFTEISKAKKRGDDFFVIEVEGEELEESYRLLNKMANTQFEQIIESGFQLPKHQINHYVFGSEVSLMFITFDPCPEAYDIFKRFGKAFEQTYTRFLDLKKVEAQAREAQIEASLERVRSRTMAMHKSTDLQQVIQSLYNEFKSLNISFNTATIQLKLDDSRDLDFWPGTETGLYKKLIHWPYVNLPTQDSTYQAWQTQGFQEIHYDKKGKDRFLTEFFKIVDAPEKYKKRLMNTEGLELIGYFKKEVGIQLLRYSCNSFSAVERDIIRRFTNSFEQSYTRFLDLQKVEAQAREAEIQLAIERIRARTLAMHRSEQLAEVAKVLFEQFNALGNIPDRMSIGIVHEKTNSIQWWVTDQKGTQIEKSYSSPLGENETIDGLYTAWCEGKDSMVMEITGEELIEWIRFVREIVKMPIDDSKMQGRRILQMAFFSSGILQLNSHEPVASEIIELLKRFAKVFEQTYTRFLDLKKAEAQAREAQIEASLERVRSKAMAMHNSSDLSSAASIVFTELRKLGIRTIRSGISLQFKEHRKNLLYTTTSSGEEENLSLAGWAILDDHPVLKEIYDSWIRGEDYFPVMKGDILKSYYEKIKSSFVVPSEHEQYKEQFGYFMVFTYGMFYGWADTPFTEDQRFILKRFSSVVDLSFKRYFDLQKAEAQTREAVKQASLDRIRGEIASMRNSEDLNRLTPVIWHELKVLEVPFFRCGVFIIDDQSEKIACYLSNPEGESLAAWHSDYDTTPLFEETVKAWKMQEVYRTEWNRKQFIEFSQILVDQGLVVDVKRYQAGKDAPDYLALQMIPFKQGMLYVGSAEKLNNEQIELVQALASAFSIAYSRYEDFRQLEKAKSEVEDTLTELRSTQTQLIHSEKMASLGELTAGIAHEIQNPLNFVNNFSEVSVDLIEDSEEGMINGNFEEVIAILEDLRQNLEKINHHGKRASSIVKGMLQHSRTSKGEREPTDLNALVDEYVRLAYHGMRAKDKSFNAEYKLELDPDLPKIKIIPQDIGRVLLNLINNAFQAVAEVVNPEVTLITQQLNNSITIRIVDNGPGIPENIRDKIFQPFFTTKPAGEGTGLGLSLSYDIITKGHKGNLKVETEPGQKTEFIIELPTG